MKTKEKKQLLSKLKQIGNLDRKHRFSQKILRGFRSNHSYQSSFQKEETPENNQNNTFNYIAASEPQSPQHHSIQQSILNKQIQSRKERKTEKSSRFKNACKQAQTQQGSPSNSYYLSSRFQFTQRMPQLLKNTPEYTASQNCSTMIEFDQKYADKYRARCQDCNQKRIFNQQKINQLQKEIKQYKGSLIKYQQRYSRLKSSVAPYVNNVELMSAIVQNLAGRGCNDSKNEHQDENNKIDYEKEQLRETAKINQWLLKEGLQKDKKFHNQSYRLKAQLDSLAGQNLNLKKEIIQRDHKIQILTEQMKNSDSVSSIRERLQMVGEELFTFKQKYHEKSYENFNLLTKIDEMKYKINALTSLIGCAVIFDVQGKDKDKIYLRQILNQIDSYENLTHNKMENNIFQYLKILKSDDEDDIFGTKPKRTPKRKLGTGRKSFQAIQGRRESKQVQQEHPNKSISIRKLYYPNYLVLLGQESISAVMEHGVIKPTLFIKLRSLLDSKYIDYRLYRTGASKFPQFCNSFLKNYEIQASQKKLYYINRFITENEAKQINMDIIRYLMDERIQDIPQIETFREFMMGKYEQDEIYFYLMCRHKLLEGSQLENYINSGDPSKFIRFDKAKRVVIKITQNFGRSIQNFICYHLNQRRILKANQQFIRLYYLLKLLLLVYRKIRNKKIVQIKDLFDNILQVTKKDRMNFMQFHELMRKNFDSFLTRTDIISMYQTTLGIFQSQKANTDFFESFAASCGSRLFQLELMKFDIKLGYECEDEQKILNLKNQQLNQSQLKQSMSMSKKSRQKMHKNTSSLNNSQFSQQYKAIKQAVEPNPINEIWPDSVYSLGNQRLTKQYINLLNGNAKRINVKLDILHFLIDAVQGHVIKQDIHLLHRDQLCSSLKTIIKTIIQFLNKLENSKLQHENQINLASRKLGKFFKNKVYEFYHEMLQDINHISLQNDGTQPGKINNQQLAQSIIKTIK